MNVANQCRFGPLLGEDGRRDPADAFAGDDRVDLSDPAVPFTSTGRSRRSGKAPTRSVCRAA
jgi:hypothetical protein